MLRLRLRRKGKGQAVDEKSLSNILKQELDGYVRREDLKGYFEEIERDKKKKALWDSLSEYKKLKILRYVLKKKGARHDKY